MTSQLATHSRVTPTSATAFDVHQSASSWRGTETATNGSQKESPPTTIQYKRLLISRAPAYQKEIDRKGALLVRDITHGITVAPKKRSEIVNP